MTHRPDLTHDVHPPRVATRRAAVQAVIDAGVVAVVRLPDLSCGDALARALLAGGVRAIEITLTTSGALDLIASLTQTFGDALLIGAGSVLTADAARQAISAGARYIVSPVCDIDVITTAHASDVPALPGAFTPTEILRAYQAGADLVKVFPSDALGPAFIKGVLGPMPFLELMPTGGVTPENVGDWISAGAVAVGLGSALVDPELIRTGDFAMLTQRAHIVTAGIAAARKNRSVT